MPEKTSPSQRIGDEAITKATGKNWEQWFHVLDATGCKKMTHKEIVNWVSQQQAAGGWWSQMITATYEQAHGIRAVHEKPEGFEISVSKTIALPRAVLFAAWHDNKLRKLWLKNVIVIRKATPDKSLRITWSDGVTSLSIEMVEKTEEKTQVVVQHQKLPDAQAAEEMKLFWKAALARLEESIKN
jgi:uncharacterized protein YndB with AHSA1/START domain